MATKQGFYQAAIVAAKRGTHWIRFSPTSPLIEVSLLQIRKGRARVIGCAVQTCHLLNDGATAALLRDEYRTAPVPEEQVRLCEETKAKLIAKAKRQIQDPQTHESVRASAVALLAKEEQDECGTCGAAIDENGERNPSEAGCADCAPEGQIALPEEETLEIVAQRCLSLSLVPRNSDSLDFHDLGVGSLKNALREAYRAGWLAAMEGKVAEAPKVRKLTVGRRDELIEAIVENEMDMWDRDCTADALLNGVEGLNNQSDDELIATYADLMGEAVEAIALTQDESEGGAK